jgi:hypothetical protein
VRLVQKTSKEVFFMDNLKLGQTKICFLGRFQNHFKADYRTKPNNYSKCLKLGLSTCWFVNSTVKKVGVWKN